MEKVETHKRVCNIQRDKEIKNKCSNKGQGEKIILGQGYENQDRAL